MAHRTALITAGSIAAVVLAAAIAIGANLGILNAADSHPVGTLSASTPVQKTGSTVVNVAGGPKAAARSQKYVIKKAGTVEVSVTKSGVRLVNVSPKRHWTWVLSQSANKKLTVTFKHGSKTYTFTAKLGSRGAIVAKVDYPVTRTVPAPASSGTSVWAASAPPPAPAPATSSSGGGDDSHEGGGGADD